MRHVASLLMGIFLFQRHFGPNGVSPPTCGGPGSGFVCCKVDNVSLVFTLKNISITSISVNVNSVVYSRIPKAIPFLCPIEVSNPRLPISIKWEEEALPPKSNSVEMGNAA